MGGLGKSCYGKHDEQKLVPFTTRGHYSSWCAAGYDSHVEQSVPISSHPDERDFQAWSGDSAATSENHSKILARCFLPTDKVPCNVRAVPIDGKLIESPALVVSMI